MRQSKLFTKTRREAPSDEVSKNAQLLIRAGFINKEMAGVYSYLPLGLLVIKKIENIIREEMDKVGGQEVLMPSFQSKENWEKTGRWSDLDVLYKVTDGTGREVALGPTHEEVVVPILKNYISSYKDFPVAVYQIQNKFRMELRSKSGILRGREFIMKDMYSFHSNKEDFELFYERMKDVYKTIFDRSGIGHLTYATFASGGSFSKYSHEFQTITPVGEDIIYIDEKSGIAVNKEVFNDDVLAQLNLKKDDLVEQKAIEVGNIFDLKTKYSAPFDLTFVDEKGEKHIVLMGCYGIGIGRLMGTIVEVLSDDRGIIWPETVAPYKWHIVEIGSEDSRVREMAENIYKEIGENNSLYDDRDLRAGEKFADSDLIGIPHRLIISEKNIKDNVVEYKNRKTGETKLIQISEISNFIKNA